MSEEKATHSKLSEARRRANKKYNDRFVEIKVRVTPEKRSIIKEHAEAMGESARLYQPSHRRSHETGSFRVATYSGIFAFRFRKTKKSGDVWIHFHTSPDDFYPHKFSHEQSPMCTFLHK